jgi:hypothetical protein
MPVTGTGGGKGGDGGSGVFLSGGNTLINAGTIAGGKGGAGSGQGTGGAGGVGVIGTGNDFVINSGTISGGESGGNPSIHANAIEFSGGGNTLELRAGSDIVGNAVSHSSITNGGDTLALGGTVESSFNVELLGDVGQAGAQYQGFAKLLKTGTSTWVLTGSTE